MATLLESLGLELPSGGLPGAVGKPLPRLPRLAAKLAVKALADFDYGTYADLPGTIATLVSREGPGVVAFVPPLAGVGLPGAYAIQVSVAACPTHLAGGPVPLAFTIRPAPAALSVAPLADFDFGTVPDIPKTVAALVKRKGDGVIRYAPSLDTVGEPGPYKVDVSVDATATHRAEGPVPLAFTVRKLPTTLTVKPLADFFSDPSAKKNALQATIKSLVGHDGDGDVVYDPPLQTLEAKPGIYAVAIRVIEGRHRKASEPKVLNFNIFMSQSDRAEAFNAWKKRAEPKQASQIGKKHVAQFVGDPTTRDAPVPMFTSADEIDDALNVLVKADIPTRDKVWKALGYDGMNGSADWKVIALGVTANGVKMHLTVSYDNIKVPQAKAGWGATAAALYTSMFSGPPIDRRVHVTLESAPTESGVAHLFVGGTNGRGDAWTRAAFGGQMGEMMDKLDEFRAAIVARMAAAKIELKVP